MSVFPTVRVKCVGQLAGVGAAGIGECDDATVILFSVGEGGTLDERFVGSTFCGFRLC